DARSGKRDALTHYRREDLLDGGIHVLRHLFARDDEKYHCGGNLGCCFYFWWRNHRGAWWVVGSAGCVVGGTWWLVLVATSVAKQSRGEAISSLHQEGP